jgi:hypothetical protein
MVAATRLCGTFAVKLKVALCGTLMKFGLGNGLPELGLQYHIQTDAKSLFQNFWREPVGLPMVAATRLWRTFSGKVKVAFLCGTLMKFGHDEKGLPELGLQCHIPNNAKSLFQNTQEEPVGLPMAAAIRPWGTFAVKLKVAFCGTLMEFGLGNGFPELGLRCHIQNDAQSLFQNTRREPVGLPMVAATRLCGTSAGKLKVAFCGTLMEFGLGNGLSLACGATSKMTPKAYFRTLGESLWDCQSSE